MARGYSPVPVTFTHSPGISASLVRTLAPRLEMLIVMAESYALEGSASNTRLRWLALPPTGCVGGMLLHGPFLLHLFVRLPRNV